MIVSRAVAIVLFAAGTLAAQRPEKMLLKDLPLVEAPAPTPSKTIGVFISGDGGWAAIDKAVSGSLQKHGVGIVGINSLKYFWRARTPEGSAADIANVIRYYRDTWKADTVILIGYSFGADVLPAIVNRLPADVRSSVVLIALIGVDHQASFKFHVTDWFSGGNSKSDPYIMPEILKFSGLRLICFYGLDETDTLCPELAAPFVVVKLSGGHHFDGGYEGIGDSIASLLLHR